MPREQRKRHKPWDVLYKNRPVGHSVQLRLEDPVQLPHEGLHIVQTLWALEKKPDGHELVQLFEAVLNLVSAGQERQSFCVGPEQLAHDG